MKPARIAVICIAAVSALGLALVVRAMGNGEPAAPAAAAPVETRPMAKILVAAKDEDSTALAEKQITDILSRRHRIAEGAELSERGGQLTMPSLPLEWEV